MSPKYITLRIWSSWRHLLLRCNADGTTRDRMPRTSWNHTLHNMGISRFGCVVYRLSAEELLLFQSDKKANKYSEVKWHHQIKAPVYTNSQINVSRLYCEIYKVIIRIHWWLFIQSPTIWNEGNWEPPLNANWRTNTALWGVIWGESWRGSGTNRTRTITIPGN